MRPLRIAAVAVGGILIVLAAATYGMWGPSLPWRQSAEMQRLAEVAGVAAGQTIAEIGAGEGKFSVRMAQLVGDSGKVYSTELTEEQRAGIRRRAEHAGLRNLLVVEAREKDTNLPEACCDLVFLRNVYHHLGDPDAFAKSLRRTVRPGGRLVIIDFEPEALWFIGGRPAEAATRRSGHGVSRAQARGELTAAGFNLEREIENWAGKMWLMLFRANGSVDR